MRTERMDGYCLLHGGSLMLRRWRERHRCLLVTEVSRGSERFGHESR